MANQAQAPRGINHLVLNVRSMEVSHKFWTEVLGFKCVAALKQVPRGRTCAFTAASPPTET
jgi:catechol 2,3-dioxygenase